MNASKEQCQRAIDATDWLFHHYPAPMDERTHDHLKYVQNFLRLALKKLPNEAAFAREKEQKR